ncbi:VCBS repeat-containing protein, partial [bacterium]|nr:VCBS repeat-containing protein [bacterium]
MKTIICGIGLLLALIGSACGQYEPVIIFEVEGDTSNQQLGHHTLVPVGDVDGDGYDDILASARTDPADSYSWEWRIYYGSADGIERYVSFAQLDSLPRSQAQSYEGLFGDMDGDGDLDPF